MVTIMGHKSVSDDLSPADIRRIRESLSLTQVEAGELLGGGPRAFTKYEAGTIKPTASVANLLRLLESNPQALKTLSGPHAVPIDGDPVRPLEVTAQHIAAVGPRRLAILTERLLAAEALAAGLPMDGIHVAAELTVGDGGEDARITWANGPDRTRFLPRRLTQFQLKATKITPAAAAAEVRDANGIKPMVGEVLSAGGAYVMVVSRTSVKQKMTKHEAGIRDAVRQAGLVIEDDQIAVRDAGQIALWVNAHPSVAAWLLERTQPGLAGPFRDWCHWAGRHEHERSPWIADARLPTFQQELRQLITPIRGVARVVGESGVGKSRLTLHALGPDDHEEVSRIPLWGLVLYAVESEAGAPVIKNTVQILVDAGVRAVVVVDRCDADTHQDLAGMVRRLGSRLSLVTIDHELPSPGKPPPGILVLSKADDPVIQGIIRSVAGDYHADEQQRLARFAKGYPQAAILIAESWSKEESLAAATDDAMLDRVLFGRRPYDKDKLLKAGMLLSTFGLVGIKAPYDDIAEIANLPGVPAEADLRAAFDDLERRRVAQPRGRLLSLQPLPISLPLAARQWRQWDQKTWERVLIENPNAGLRERAARQLAMLNREDISRVVAQAVCRRRGPFDSLEALTQPPAGKVLTSLAEIDVEAVANLFESVLGELTTEELQKITGDARRHLVRALETIAFHAETFEQGARLLMVLAAAENESWSNNATGQFNALFHVIAGTTQASAETRLRFLDDALTTNDARLLAIAVGGALAGAETGSVIRTGSPGQYGSRPALPSWKPKYWNEVWDYIAECLRRLAKIATRVDAAGRQAKIGIGQDFRSLVSKGCVDLVEEIVTTVTAGLGGYWPEARSSLGDVLVYDRKGLDADVEARVRTLIARLTPTDIAGRVRSLVTEMPWDYPEDEKLDHHEREVRQVAAIEALVTELLSRPEELSGFLAPLSRGSHRMTFQFGQALATQAAAPLDWEEGILGAYAAAPVGERNFGLLAGFVSGLAPRFPEKVEAFKAEAATSPIFAAALPLICFRLGIAERDVVLVCTAVEGGHLAAHLLQQWVFGGVLAKLPPSAVSPMFDMLLARDGEAYAVALDLLGMYVHGQSDRLDELRPQLLLAANNLRLLMEQRRSQTDEHHFKELIDWLLAKGRDDQDACTLALTLTKKIIALDESRSTEIAKSLLPRLLKNFPEIVWPILGEAIVSDRANGWRLEHALGDSFSFHVKQPAILHLPLNLLMAWCHAHPNEAPAFVAAILPVLTSRDPEDAARTLHPTVKRLLDEFGDRPDVLSALTRNMYTFGWSGSRTTYFALYDEPLRLLETHPVAQVRRWASKSRNQLQRDIAETRTEEEERDADWGL
jgi:transcriptional regulator with XRE-family HTH domain